MIPPQQNLLTWRESYSESDERHQINQEERNCHYFRQRQQLFLLMMMRTFIKSPFYIISGMVCSFSYFLLKVISTLSLPVIYYHE